MVAHWGGPGGGSKQVGESPEAVILQVLLPIIKIPIFFEIWAKICQNLTKKNFQNFYLINDQMSLKFEANFANKNFLGVNLLLFDKIMLKFQISWKSDHFWPKFTNKKPFLLSKNFLKFFFVKSHAQSSNLHYAISQKKLRGQNSILLYKMIETVSFLRNR